MKQILLMIAVVALVGCADQGHAMTQFNLGVMYRKGEGVEQDFKEAIKWYQKAADQGEANAQYSLGVIYEMSKGVEQNYVTAYAWASIAATNGNNIAPEFKSQFLEPKMTPAQIAKAEELVKEMVKKNPKLMK
jgi:TPR repeat protein